MDERKPVVHLHQENVKDWLHMTVITNIVKYKKANGFSCFYCPKVELNSSVMHKCKSPRKKCEDCFRYIQFKNTLVYDDNKRQFCDSQIAEENPKKCKDCLKTFR